jgi:hypothetical protein
MLFGAQTAKADIRIRRFVAQAIDRGVTNVQALRLLEIASTRVGLPLRDVDDALWSRRQSAIRTPKRS